jgi:MoxR-like ATPase
MEIVMMNSGKNGVLRETAWQIYDYVKETFVLNRPDMTVKGVRFNSALLMSSLTGLCQGKELIIGEPGLGKTTSAEYICALLYQFPLGVIWRSEVAGHPEQTEEKIIGRPDLGKLNQGDEVVVWSYFSQLPVKIVDEINRLPETKQSMILDGVDRGKWEYLNDAIINREFCLFATANYQDRGTNTIIAPLVDRFDIIVESKHPGANLAYQIGILGSNGQALRHETIEDEFHHILNARLPYHVRMDRVDEICDRFAKALVKSSGIRTLSRAERQAIRFQIEAIPFDLDSNAFLRFVLAELSFCYRFGQKRSHESCEEGCHFTGYLCNTTQNCVSNRLPISVRSFSQALAWFLGDEAVGLEHLIAVLPFALAHRVQWKEEASAQCDKEVRNDPLVIYMAKKAVKETHRRFMEQSSQVKDALSIACRIAEGETVEPIRGDHPIYWEILKDIGEEVSE